MELFGIGPGELMIIMVLALIIVGPQKLPELGRNLGRTVGEFKAQTDQMRSVLNFDSLTAPTTPAAAPVAHSERDTQALVHTDERVLALQAYTAAPAIPVIDEPETIVITPAAQSATQEPAA